MTLEEIDQENIKIISVRLFLLRKKHKLTQKELSRMLGCNQRYISDWEIRKRLIPIRFLFRICYLLKVKLEYFDINIPGPEGKLEVCSGCKSESWSQVGEI